jgi:hypothetical protein
MLEKWPDSNIRIVDLFQHPTIDTQASLIHAENQQSINQNIIPPKVEMCIPTATHKDVAIIGIAGRFPGASNPDEFYQLLLDQKEALSLFPETSNTSATLPDTKHVPVRGALLDVNYFDFSHWGIPEDEAR